MNALGRSPGETTATISVLGLGTDGARAVLDGDRPVAPDVEHRLDEAPARG